MTLGGQLPRIGRLCLVATALTVAACHAAPRSEEEAKIVASPAELADSTEAGGGSPRAWLTAAGDVADTNYCDVPLKLPLEREPAWIHEYGYAFSDSPVGSIVHHSGILVLTARCSQLLGIDAATGTQLFNVDVYRHLDRDRRERLSGVFMHPRGRLLAGQDDLGRHYLWSLTPAGPHEEWVGDVTGENSGFVVTGDSLYTRWDLSVHCLSLRDGSSQWAYPNLVGRCGIVYGQSGVLLAWTRGGGFYALRADDGQLLWCYMANVSSDYSRAIIDDEANSVYLVLDDECVERRALQTGELAWRHDWGDLVPAEKRTRLEDATAQKGYPSPPVSPMLTPLGAVAPSYAGTVVALDHDGTRRWSYVSEVAVVGAIAFANAVLIGERYIGPEYRGFIQWQSIFCPEAPDWEVFRQASAERQAGGIFQRLAVLDLKSGAVLDVFELEQPPTALIPALDKIIVAEMGRPRVDKHRVLAWNWLEWEGD